MIVNLQELAERMLANYDARTPGELVGEPLDLSTAQAYALQAEIAPLREQRGKSHRLQSRLHEQADPDADSGEFSVFCARIVFSD